MSRVKTALNNILLYLGLIGKFSLPTLISVTGSGYTALGAKIFQMLELPSEKDRLETHQALLLTERQVFLEVITNNTDLEEDQYHQVTPSVTSSPDQPCCSWCLKLSRLMKKCVQKCLEQVRGYSSFSHL